MIDFEEFCASEFLGGQDKRDFESWLGQQASKLHTKNEWLRLFNEWLRATQIPRRARQ